MLPTRRSKALYSRGITLIELLIAMVVISISLLSLLLILTQAMSDARFAAVQTELDSQLSFALTRIEDDVKLASNFSGNVNAPFADSYEPTTEWDYTGDSEDDRVLILSMPATVNRANTPGRILTYRDDAAYNCSSELTLNTVHTYRVVFFVENQTLYKRFLTDTTSPLCNSQVQKQSCPVDDIGSWPSECEARDEIIAENVDSFSVDYAFGGETSAISSQYSDPAFIQKAKAAIVTIGLRSGPGESAAVSSATLRMARLNQ
jgi:prepilin-type N-terminal cleavage/methylation domain-containing protein